MHRVVVLDDGSQITVADSQHQERSSVVLALPGWKGSDLGLRGLYAPAVADGFRMVTINLPGAGLSPAPYVRMTEIEVVARLVEDLALALDLGDQLLLLGHSFGATVMTLVAARSRIAVHGVLLVSPVANAGINRRGWSGFAGKAALAAASAAFGEAPLTISHRAIRSTVVENVSNTVLARRGLSGALRIHRLSKRERGFAADPRAMADQFRIASQHGCSEWAQDVQHPVWIIAGDQDQMSSVAELASLQSSFQRCQIAYVEGAGHLGHHEDVDQFSALAASCLRSLADPAGIPRA